MIQLSDLSKSFGDRSLIDHVTWQISDGDRVGLCGPNGAGKTTLLKMMAGLDEPDSGAILKPSALTVGYLPQDGLAHAGRTIAPSSGSSRPASIFSSVVLPAPFGPQRPTRSPSEICHVTWSIRVRSPNALVSSESWITPPERRALSTRRPAPAEPGTVW